MKILSRFRSRRYAVTLILLLTLSLVLATVIPQESRMSEVEEFRLRVNYPGFAEFISYTGLNSVYTSWWFLLIVLLTTLNLSFNLRERVRIAKRQFTDITPVEAGEAEGMQFHHAFSSSAEDTDRNGRISRFFSGQGYRVREFEGGLSAVKGWFGHWNVPLFHGSLLIILTGILISSLTKFNGTFEISEGQMFRPDDSSFINRSDGLLGIDTGFDFSLFLRKFTLEYWNSEQPRLYQSRVEVHRNGNVLLSRDVEMNEPLEYNGFYFYQTKYHGYSALLTVSGKDGGRRQSGYVNFPFRSHYSGILEQDFRIPMSGLMAKLRLDVNRPDLLVATVSDKKGPRWEGIIPEGSGIDLGEYVLELKSIVRWTGMYVSRDYAVPVVYSGFALLVISVFSMIFIVPRKISVLYHDDRVIVGVRVSRDREAFREEFEKIIGKMDGILK